MEAVLNNPLVLITDRKITMIQDIMPVLEKVVQGGRELLIHPGDTDRERAVRLGGRFLYGRKEGRGWREGLPHPHG